jgi:hypothetical protein
MRAVLTKPFAANRIASPPEVQEAFGKQLTNLLRDLRHPLRPKKYEERTGLSQARITTTDGCTSPSTAGPALSSGSAFAASQVEQRRATRWRG